MRVRLAKSKDKIAWDNYVDTHPNSVPYCRFSWKDSVEKAYGHKAYYLLAEEEGAILGIFPLFLFRVPFLGDSLVSLPFCDVGGILANNEKCYKALLAEGFSIGSKGKVKNIEVRSCQKHPDELQENVDWFHSLETSKVRMLLKLPQSSEELWKSFKSKLRSQVRKAEKNGLMFRWGDIDDLNSFYQVFSQNMHDLGSPVHGRKWIESILMEFGDNARMGLIFKDEEPIGCGIILFTKHNVSIPWASTLRRYNRLSPNMMLYWSFLKFAADNEKKIFDFGRSTPNEGTYRFKKQWGAEPDQLFWYKFSIKECDQQAIAGGKRQQVEQIWQKMPLFLANFIGPRIRKYISL